MAYRFTTPAGDLTLRRADGHWSLSFRRQRGGHWKTALQATTAVSAGRSGLPAWDALAAEHPVPPHPRDWEWLAPPRPGEGRAG